MDISLEYLHLYKIIKVQRKIHDKYISDNLKNQPWYYYLTKIGFVDFLQNEAPDKASKLFASPAFEENLLRFNRPEREALQLYSKLNVKLQKEASIDAVSYRAIGLIAITFSFLIFLLSIGEYANVISWYKNTIRYLTLNFKEAFIFIQIMLVPVILMMIITLISLFARIYYLDKAIEIDRNLEKALLIIKMKGVR